MTPYILRKFRSYSFLLVLLYCFSLPVYAQATVAGPTTAMTMLQSIANQIPYLMQMVTATAYVMGMFLIIRGVIKLKHLGESRTMMSHEHSLMGPMFYLIIGVLLLYVPTGVDVGLSTFWTNPNPYGYTDIKGQWGEFIGVIYLIVQFIGTLTFLRGLTILSHVGQQGGGSQGAWGKGLAHVIGGILCINVYQTVQVIFATLGINAPFQ